MVTIWLLAKVDTHEIGTITGELQTLGINVGLGGSGVYNATET
jgi:hypothetical protein